VCEDATRAEVWVVDDGTVRRFDGAFDDYKAQLIAEVIKEQDEE